MEIKKGEQAFKLKDLPGLVFGWMGENPVTIFISVFVIFVAVIAFVLNR